MTTRALFEVPDRANGFFETPTGGQSFALFEISDRDNGFFPMPPQGGQSFALFGVAIRFESPPLVVPVVDFLDAFVTIEDAIHVWVTGATGFGDDKVIWEAQNGPRPAKPYIVMSLPIDPNNRNWIEVETNPFPSDGKEILHRSRGVHEAPLTLTIFLDESTGASAGRSFLQRVISLAPLPTYADALQIANIGILRIEPIRIIGAVISVSDWEPRATVTIHLSLADSSASETGTNILTVDPPEFLGDP